MNIALYEILFFLLGVSIIGCQSEKSEKTNLVEHAITSYFDDLKNEKYDFIISSFDEGVERSDFNMNSLATFDSAIIKHFSYPIDLKQEINKGNIKEYGTFFFQNKTYTFSDLLSMPSEKKGLNEIDFYQLDSIYKSIMKEDSNNKLISYSGKISSRDLLATMASLSNKFQKTKISGFIRDTIFSNPNGNMFLDKIYRHGGWRVFIFDGQAILWNYFEEGKNAVLMLNVMNHGIFAGIVCPKSDVISPIKDDALDLLQSPIAARVLRYLYCPRLKHIECSSALSEKEKVLNSKYRFLFAKELKLLAQNHKKQGKTKKSEEEFHLHDEIFSNNIPSRYSIKKPLVKIDYVRNNAQITKSFEIETDTIVRLFSSGQVVKEKPSVVRVKGRDNVDIFLRSKNNEKIKCWQRIYYQCPYYMGRKDSPMLFPYAFKDISDSSYQLEIKLPWSFINTIDKKKYLMQAVFGFNDSDNDPLKIESRIASSATLLDLKCVKYIPQLKSQALYALKTDSKPKIDGEMDSIWKEVPNQIMDIVTKGKVENSNDNACSFKAMWDDESLYLLFTVVDQVKTYPYVITKDFCRIVNQETGNLIWQSNENKGDFFPFYVSDDKIRLKKGEYVLEYESDNCFSFSEWHDHTLPTSFYGTYLYIE